MRWARARSWMPPSSARPARRRTGEEARPEMEAGGQGQELLLWHEAAYRGGQPLGTGTQRGGDGRDRMHDKHPLPRLRCTAAEVQGLRRQCVCQPARTDRSEGAAGRNCTNQRCAISMGCPTRSSGARIEKSKVRARVEHVFAIIKRSGGSARRATGPAQERDARVHRVGIGQHLHEPRAVAGTGASVRDKERPQGLRKQQDNAQVRVLGHEDAQCEMGSSSVAEIEG